MPQALTEGVMERRIRRLPCKGSLYEPGGRSWLRAFSQTEGVTTRINPKNPENAGGIPKDGAASRAIMSVQFAYAVQPWNYSWINQHWQWAMPMSR